MDQERPSPVRRRLRTTSRDGIKNFDEIPSETLSVVLDGVSDLADTERFGAYFSRITGRENMVPRGDHSLRVRFRVCCRGF